MKIDTQRIPSEGMTLEERIVASELELDTETISFRQPIEIKAAVSRITNSITVSLIMQYNMHASCSRCLNDFSVELKKELKLNYVADKHKPTIDLNPEIREEIILDYPLKPLCNQQCKGLCPRCGKNLNEGTCDCR